MIFRQCSSLSSVVFESDSSSTLISYRSFYLATSLTSLSIPASVTQSAYDAFEASSLILVIFDPGSRLESLGNNVFKACTSLTGKVCLSLY